jgi:hypothetical protein
MQNDISLIVNALKQNTFCSRYEIKRMQKSPNPPKMWTLSDTNINGFQVYNPYILADKFISFET